jgi:hypothetical protein
MELMLVSIRKVRSMLAVLMTVVSIGTCCNSRCLMTFNLRATVRRLNLVFHIIHIYVNM